MPDALSTRRTTATATPRARCAAARDLTNGEEKAEAFLLERTAPELLTLTRQVARLNPDAGGIGAGMLVQHVTTVAGRAQ